MVNSKVVAALLGSASQVLAQSYQNAPAYVSHPDRADAVKQAFQISWDGYYQYAFPNDSLLPISKSYQNDRCVNIARDTNSSYMLTKILETDGVPARLMPFLLL